MFDSVKSLMFLIILNTASQAVIDKKIPCKECVSTCVDKPARLSSVFVKNNKNENKYWNGNAVSTCVADGQLLPRLHQSAC